MVKQSVSIEATLYHASLSRNEYTELLRGIGFEVIGHAVDDGRPEVAAPVWLTRTRANCGRSAPARGQALSRSPRA